MSMMFGGDRDYIETINGVDYYSDSSGNILSDDGFSMDVVDDPEIIEELEDENY